MKSLSLAFVLLFSLEAFAIESDSLKMSHWISTARQQMNLDANQGKIYLDSLHSFLETHTGYLFQEGEYHKLLAIYYYRKNLYDSSLIHYNIANRKFNALNNILEQAKISVNVSMIYNRKGEYKETIDYASSALTLFEQLDDKKGMGISLNIIGQVYFANGDFKNAAKYFKRYINNAILTQDSTEIASGYANLGSAFSKQQNYDSSLYYTKKALSIQMKLNALYSIGNALQNMATDFQKKGMQDSATYYYERAAEYYEKVDSKAGLAEVYFNLGVTEALRGNFNKAIVLQEKSLGISRQIGELFLQKENLFNLSKNYERIGLRDKAFDLYKAYDVLSDSILNENNKRYIEDINAKYETEKKEQQIVMQQIALDQQQAQIKFNYAIIVAMCFGLLLLVIIFLLLRNKARKKQEYLKAENDLKLREAYINASIQSQESERKRFAQDLHDGMGQLISSLRLLLGSINENATTESRLKVVSKSETIIDEMQKEIRGIAFNLMPQTLIQHGLVPALKEMALRINSTGRVMVLVNSFDTPDRLSEVQEISLYRTVQEWVNNILKYAEATQIEIQIVGHGDELNITIDDNGKGFDVTVLEKSTGNGWRNILSRVKLLHGEVEVDSSNGRNGTILIAKVPLTIPEEGTVANKDNKIPIGTDGITVR